MKKNIVIIILSIVILSLGGYLVYDKVIDKDENTISKEEVKEESYDLTLAKELVDKYYSAHFFTEGSTFDDMSEVSMMKNAYAKATENYTCTELYANDERATGYEFERDTGNPVSYRVEIDDKYFLICDDDVSHIVSYDNANEIYKELYGKNLNMAKESFGGRPFGIIYDDKNDVYALTIHQGGGPGTYKTFYDVKSAKMLGEQLIIDIGYEVFTPCYGQDPWITEKYCSRSTKIAATYDDSMDNKNFTAENFLNFDTYRFILDKEDDHYILNSYVKVLK